VSVAVGESSYYLPLGRKKMSSHQYSCLLFYVLVIVLCLFQLADGSLTGSVAAVTFYASYPPCCRNSPNYDSAASTDECADYSGCTYLGDFAAIGTKSFSYVRR
jgi:hypothetical protein